MKTSQFLQHLRERGIKVWAEEGKLRISAAKGTLTPELRGELAARKSEILAALGSASAGSAEGATPPVEPIPRGGDLPLSFSQRRLWFMQQLEPAMFAYNLPLAWQLEGPLDVALLEEVLNRLIARHEALRSAFPEVDGVPVQRPLDPPPRQRLVVERNEQGLPLERWRRTIAERMTAAGERPFDLAVAPLLRLHLFEVRPEEHLLLVTVHHIVMDGVSIAVLAREMSALYEALAKGRPSPLPELSVQYADFAAWQERLFASGVLERQVAFWKRTLGGRLPILDLPTDGPRPPIQTFNGDKQFLDVSDELYQRVAALAKREGVTVYMAFLAAFKLLLARFGGLEDVIVGTAVDGRPRPEVEQVVGFFVNTVALRSDLSGDPTFRELLLRVRDTCLEAFEHKDMPFERLVDELQPERNLSYSPIFQALFFHELAPAPAASKQGLSFSSAKAMDGWELRTAKNDLALWINYDAKGLYSWFEYNTDLFSAERMRAMLRSYRAILAAVVEDPSLPLSRIPLLEEADRRLLLEDWNASAAAFPVSPVHAQFEARADASPEAAAVVFPGATEAEDRTLTYAELDVAANRLARHLVAEGVEPGSLVGLCLERSAEMIVAQLAIQKAGAAYVPLDPTYPVDRLRYMVEDAGLRFVVTTDELAGLLDLGPGVRPVSLDGEAEAIGARPSGRPGIAVDARDRMYVIYTSGSTGRPKGVELEHRSVSNFLASMAREPGMRAGERLLAVTTLSFDISVLETMLPLVVGGTVIVAPREAVTDGEHLMALLARLRPALMQATPATWRLLLLSGWEGAQDLRLLVGGEALPRELAAELVPRCAELWNMYGPTECTIWSTIQHVRAEDPTITIGRPIANTQVFVLDGGGAPVPVGVSGELWIGGDGLARGYLGRPELTAERFPERTLPREGAPRRLYRTGDIARWTPEGRLECLGRVDDQVKLRGFRIELGEIEAVLEERAEVDQCVCVVREDTPGDQRMVAYYGAAGGELDPELLRAAARDKLPGYMVPSAFQRLEAFPQTPNGKVDRKALRALPAPDQAPDRASGTAPTPQRAPEGELQVELAGYWAETLKLESVPADANFFDLGGHSLLLAQVHARLRKAHPALGLSIIELFQFPTVEGLAAHMERKSAGQAAPRREGEGRDLASGRRALMRRRRGR